MNTLRILHTGLRGARENLSLTEALCQSHKAGRMADCLRLQHFPPSAIIGRHQRLEAEVNLAYCRANGIETARRMTGGGAIIMAPGILGWELILSRGSLPASLADVSALICTGAASGLSRLGIAAAFRPRNDIEVAGRKISGTGGYFDGNTLVFQGTVLVQLDADLLNNALTLPAHKLEKRGLTSLDARVTDLQALLGTAPAMAEVEAALLAGLCDALGRDAALDTLTQDEETLAARLYTEEIGMDRFVTGADDALAPPGRVVEAQAVTPGGLIHARLKLRDGAGKRLDHLTLTGDFFVTPPRVIADLEAHLRHAPLDRACQMAQDFLNLAAPQFLGITQADLLGVIAAVLDEAKR
jgi:lipoate---protein ligase